MGKFEQLKADIRSMRLFEPLDEPDSQPKFKGLDPSALPRGNEQRDLMINDLQDIRTRLKHTEEMIDRMTRRAGIRTFWITLAAAVLGGLICQLAERLIGYFLSI